MTFSDRLEMLLKQNKMTQKELAEYLGIRQPSISDWKKEGSIPRADIAVKIAQRFGVSTEYLVTGQDPTKPDISEAIRKIENGLEDLKKV